MEKYICEFASKCKVDGCVHKNPHTDSWGCESFCGFTGRYTNCIPYKTIIDKMFDKLCEEL